MTTLTGWVLVLLYVRSSTSYSSGPIVCLDNEILSYWGPDHPDNPVESVFDVVPPPGEYCSPEVVAITHTTTEDTRVVEFSEKQTYKLTITYYETAVSDGRSASIINGYGWAVGVEQSYYYVEGPDWHRMAPVPRTLGWHQFQVIQTEQVLRVKVDGITVLWTNGHTQLSRLTLQVSAESENPLVSSIWGAWHVCTDCDEYPPPPPPCSDTHATWSECGPGCPAGCNVLEVVASCRDTCVPGCFCNPGYQTGNDGLCTPGCGEADYYERCEAAPVVSHRDVPRKGVPTSEPFVVAWNFQVTAEVDVSYLGRHEASTPLSRSAEVGLYYKLNRTRLALGTVHPQGGLVMDGYRYTPITTTRLVPQVDYTLLVTTGDGVWLTFHAFPDGVVYDPRITFLSRGMDHPASSGDYSAPSLLPENLEGREDNYMAANLIIHTPDAYCGKYWWELAFPEHDFQQTPNDAVCPLEATCAGTSFVWEGGPDGQITSPVVTEHIPRHFTTFRINGHQLHGTVDWGSLPPNLQWLSLSDNNLEGTVDWKALPSSLTTLHIRSCQFTGGVNTWDMPRGLRILGMSYTLLSGDFDVKGLPRQLGVLEMIGTNNPDGLRAHYNFSDLPQGLSQYHASHNPQFGGTLEGITGMTKLVALGIEDGQYTGPIPPLPPGLGYFSVGRNKLSGPVDFSNLPPQMENFWASHNQLTGTVVITDSLPTTMKRLDVQHNPLDMCRTTIDLSTERPTLTLVLPPETLPCTVGELTCNDPNKHFCPVTSGCVDNCDDTCGVGYQPLHQVHEGIIFPVCMIPEEENFCNHDGRVDLEKEECDDGNTVNHDGCTDCHWDDDWESSQQCNGCVDGYRTIEYGIKRASTGGPDDYNGAMTHLINDTTVTFLITAPFVANGVVAVEVEGQSHVDKVMSQMSNPWLRDATPCWDPIGPLLPPGWTLAVDLRHPCDITVQTSFDLFSGDVPAGCDRVVDSNNQEQQSVRLICGVFLKLYYGITSLVNVWPVEGILPAAFAHYKQMEVTVHLNTTNNPEKPPFEVALADSTLRVDDDCYLEGTVEVQVPKDGKAQVDPSGEFTIISNRHSYIVTYDHTKSTPSNIDLLVFTVKSLEPSDDFGEDTILTVQLEGGDKISLLLKIHGKCTKYKETTNLGVVDLECRKKGTTGDQPSDVYGTNNVMYVLIPWVTDILQLDISRVTAVFKNIENNDVIPIITKGQWINPYFEGSWEEAPSEFEALLTLRVAILPGRYILSMELPYLYVGNSTVIGREKFATQEEEEGHRETQAIAQGEYLFQVMATSSSSDEVDAAPPTTEGGGDERSPTNKTPPTTEGEGGDNESRPPANDHTEQPGPSVVEGVVVEMREGVVELQKSDSVEPITMVVVVGVGIVVVFMAVVIVGVVLALKQYKKAAGSGVQKKEVPNDETLSAQPDSQLQDDLHL